MSVIPYKKRSLSQLQNSLIVSHSSVADRESEIKAPHFIAPFSVLIIYDVNFFNFFNEMLKFLSR